MLSFLFLLQKLPEMGQDYGYNHLALGTLYIKTNSVIQQNP